MSSPIATTISVCHRSLNTRTKPVGLGVPFCRDELSDAARLAVWSEAGDAVPAQAKSLLTWPDGTVKWALVEFLPCVPPGKVGQYRLTIEDKPLLAPLPSVRIEDKDDQVVVDNGRLRFAISKKEFRLFAWLTLDGVPLVAEDTSSDLVVVGANGQRHYASCDPNFQVAVEEEGALHSVVKVTGTHLSHGGRGRLLDFQLRYHVYAGWPVVRLEHTFVNRQPPEEGADIRTIYATVALALGKETKRAIWYKGIMQPTPPQAVEIPENVSIQAQEGTFQPQIENTASLGLEGGPTDFYRTPGWEKFVRPYIDVTDGEKGAMGFFEEMSPNCPKEIASDGNVLEFHFYPAWAAPLKLPRGMSKRHWLVLAFHTGDFGPDERNLLYLDWDGILEATIPAERYCQCQVADMHRILPYQPRKYLKLERKIQRLFCVNWPSGWKDRGDEMGPWASPQRSSAWMNHEEDFVRAAMTQYFRIAGYYRTGNSLNSGYRLFLDARMAALHLMDIDFVDSSADPLREGAVIPHAREHVLNMVQTSHMWIDGLLMYYEASGDPEALRVARAVGDCLLRWLEQRPEVVFSTGRETGRPLLNLAALYEATRDERYRVGAQKLIAEYRRRLTAENGLYYPIEGAWRQDYAGYAAPEALYRYWLATGDEEAKLLALDIINWLIRDCLDPDGVYDYGGIELPNMAIFYQAYLWTGDERYLEMGRPGLSLFLAESPMPQAGAGFYVHQAWHYLKLADERGWIDDSEVPMVHGVSNFRFGARYDAW